MINPERTVSASVATLVSGDASSELWLDEALAETFPASDPIPWRREVPQPVESEATRAQFDLGGGSQ